MESLLVTDNETLLAACARLEASARVALDTEFVRERTYAAELALVQVCDGAEVDLVDPLAGADLAPLVALLGNPGRTKVLHAGRQDLEVLLPACGAPPGPVLDTQIAAALLGMPPQVGYADLVERELAVRLAKGHARTDWTRRPLSAAQLEYAADDVRWLLPLAERLESRLESAGRREWLLEECAALADPRLYRSDPADAWQRLRGIESLPPREQLRLRALARWREERAQRRNLPRAWVATDDALREIARRAPTEVAALRVLGVLPEGAVAKIGPEIVATLAGAATDTDEGLVQRADARPSAEEQALAKRLGARVRSIADALAIAPEVLATQRDLRRLARGDRDVAPLRGWRRGAVGEALLEELARG